eukprot:CAMPEP_0176270346 /NCGR_PEP_ID=MMETSP0121_2-20121125/44651_1 /TAXON_ID=160619 /ORGANISM="Kryptoperidinium foliaceum, Strain CCMP 1326" /LENGTH=58 /DNA_ID=CAMNT_0017610485 /DNA_START=26 /DNA_END=200 /DNA_ORIENTATION=-
MIVRPPSPKAREAAHAPYPGAAAAGRTEHRLPPSPNSPASCRRSHMRHRSATAAARED